MALTGPANASTPMRAAAIDHRLCMWMSPPQDLSIHVRWPGIVRQATVLWVGWDFWATRDAPFCGAPRHHREGDPTDPYAGQMAQSSCEIVCLVPHPARAQLLTRAH